MEKLEREETIKSLCDADTHGLDGKVRDGFVRKCISIGVMELLATIYEKPTTESYEVDIPILK